MFPHYPGTTSQQRGTHVNPRILGGQAIRSDSNASILRIRSNKRAKNLESIGQTRTKRPVSDRIGYNSRSREIGGRAEGGEIGGRNVPEEGDSRELSTAAAGDGVGSAARTDGGWEREERGGGGSR